MKRARFVLPWVFLITGVFGLRTVVTQMFSQQRPLSLEREYSNEQFVVYKIDGLGL